MAGYSPSPFCIFFERDKERGQYSAILTDQPWSIKDLSILPKKELLRDQRGKSRAGSWVANQNAGFASSCPLADLAI